MLKLDDRFMRPNKKHWPELLRDYVEKRRAGGADKKQAVVGGMRDMFQLWGISITSPRDLLDE